MSLHQLKESRRWIVQYPNPEPPPRLKQEYFGRRLERGAGGDLKSVLEIASHSRIDTTTRIYQHTNLTFLRHEINKLSTLTIPTTPEKRKKRAESKIAKA